MNIASRLSLLLLTALLAVCIPVDSFASGKVHLGGFSPTRDVFLGAQALQSIEATKGISVDGYECTLSIREFTDPDGRAAKVEVRGRTVNVTSTLVTFPSQGYLDSGGSVEAMQKDVAPAMKKGIEARWGNVPFTASGKKYTMKVTANIVVANDEQDALKRSQEMAAGGTPNDVMGIQQGGFGTNHAAKVAGPQTSEGSEVSAPSILNGSGTLAHEEGHLLGLPNTNSPEHAGHLMFNGSRLGPVDKRQVAPHEAADVIKNNGINLGTTAEQRATQQNMPGYQASP